METKEKLLDFTISQWKLRISSWALQRTNTYLNKQQLRTCWILSLAYFWIEKKNSVCCSDLKSSFVKPHSIFSTQHGCNHHCSRTASPLKRQFQSANTLQYEHLHFTLQLLRYHQLFLVELQFFFPCLYPREWCYSIWLCETEAVQKLARLSLT